MNTLKITLFLFLGFLSILTSNAQNEQIEGPTEMVSSCCDTFKVTIFDSVQVEGYWELFDGSIKIDDGWTVGGTHIFVVCPNDYKLQTNQLILTFQVEQLDIFIRKIIEIIKSRELAVYRNYDCLIPDSTNCDIICEGTIGTYFIEGDSLRWKTNWEVSGGIILDQSIESLSVLWNTPGIHEVKITARIGGCEVERVICVEVKQKPIADFTSIPSYSTSKTITICKGQTIYFESTSKNALIYQWLFGDGTSDDKLSTSHEYPIAGQYEVIHVIENGCDCVDAITINIVVLDAPAPILKCIGTTCPGEENTYYVESDCSDIEWSVSANGKVLEGGQSKDDYITIQWQEGPIGTITVLGKNCPVGYCSLPSTFRIPVISTNGPIEGDQLVCEGQIVTYSAPFYQATEYIWTVSLGAEILGHPTLNTIQIAWNNTNAPNHNQWIEVVYDNCYLSCGGYDKIDISVLGEYKIIGEQKYCQNDILNFNAIKSKSGTAVNCTWKIYDENEILKASSTGIMSNYVVTSNLQAGNYHVESTTNLNDYCDPIIQFDFEILKSPIAPSGITTFHEICLNSTHHFEIDNYNPNYALVWEVVDGPNKQIFENLISIDYIFKSAGPYEINVWYEDLSGLNCQSKIITKTLRAFQVVADGSDEVCLESTVKYNATNTNNTAMSWAINPSYAGVIISGQGTSEIEVFWAISGNHVLALEQCASVFTINVVVLGDANPIVQHPSKLCKGDMGWASVAKSYTSVEWKIDGVFLGTGSNISIGPGYYSVDVVDVNGCHGLEQFVVRELPNPEAVITTASIRGFCEIEPFSPKRIYANTDGSYHYQWYKDGVKISIDDPTYDVIEYGVYWMEVTSEDGCKNISNEVRFFKYCDIGTCGGTCTGGKCNKTTCPMNIDFIVTPDPFYCNKVSFKDKSVETIAWRQWLFEEYDPMGWDIDLAIEPVHVFPTAGYHTVIYDVLVNPKPNVDCRDHKIKVVKVPVAAWFTAENSCKNIPLKFNDLSTFLPDESIKGWQWKFGDPTSGTKNTSSDQNPFHTYQNSGFYKVELIIESLNGCHSKYELQVEVFEGPIFDFNLPKEICIGAPLEVKVPNGLNNFEWTFGDPTTLQANNSKVTPTFHAYEKPGKYTVTLLVTDVYGCDNMTSHDIEIVDPSLDRSIIVDGVIPFCKGGSVKLTAPKNGVRWVWNTGEITKEIVIRKTGEYFVLAENASGCIYESLPVSVLVMPNPAVIAIAEKVNDNGIVEKFHPSSLDICFGEIAKIKAIANGNLSYKWSNGRTTNEVEFGAYSLPIGTHNFTVIVVDNNTGCSSTSNVISINVYAMPLVPFIVYQPTGVLCENESVRFSISNYDPNFTYHWNTGQTGKEITVSGAGDYYVTVFNKVGCSAKSQSTTIYPAPDADYIMSGCFVRCTPDTICYPDFQIQVTYQWYKDGNIIPSPEGIDKEFIAKESGVYTLELTSPHGCKDISSDLNLDITPSFGDLKVTVYFDANDNGIIDPADYILDDVEVEITKPSSIKTIKVVDGNGQAFLYNEEGGEYLAVCKDSRYQWVIDSATIEIIGCGDPYEINLLAKDLCSRINIDIDTIICAIDTILIGHIEITKEGDYIMMDTTTNGCDSITTIKVSLRPEELFEMDTLLCNKDDFIWNGHKFSDEGTYSIRDTNEYGCIEVHNICLRRVFDTYELDTALCEIDSLVLFDTCFYHEGEYILENINSYGCLEIKQINLSFNQPDNLINAYIYIDKNENGIIDTEDDAIKDKKIMLNKGSHYIEEYPSDSNGKVVFGNLSIGEYSVQLDSVGLWPRYGVVIMSDTTVIAGCGDEVTLRLLIVKNKTTIYIPNVFSPNGDSANDKFRVFTANENDQIKSLEIYDRWGELIFSDHILQKVPDVSWDGKLNGVEMNPGVYVYKVEVLDLHGELKIFTGDVTLVR